MHDDEERDCSICHGAHSSDGEALSCAAMDWAARGATIAVLQRKLETITKAALDCGTSSDNPDTCGVCHLHFAECELDQVCVGDVVNEHDIPIGREPACPGARVRAVLSK